MYKIVQKGFSAVILYGGYWIYGRSLDPAVPAPLKWNSHTHARAHTQTFFHFLPFPWELYIGVDGFTIHLLLTVYRHQPIFNG